MALEIPRLRKWFAVAAILMVVTVAGFYLYARWRLRGVVKHLPAAIGLEIQQSAEGFSVSKSEEGRTLFTARASKAVQFKKGGRAELHQVTITVYGRDASRFDQISGDAFDYDPATGDITAVGEVQIDLEANPAGLATPDQTPPRELKNPIHVRTRGLVFNQKTGNAYTREKVEFNIVQANGWALGATYTGKTNTLVLDSQVVIHTLSPSQATLTAARGTITKEPRRVVLDRVQLSHGGQEVAADQATAFMNRQNVIERVLAQGNVHIATPGKTHLEARAQQAEMFMTGDKRDTLRAAVLSGDVHVETSGDQSLQGTAGRLTLDFAGRNLLAKARAEQNVKLVQLPSAARTKAPESSQRVELTAPILDFVLAHGRHLVSAVTSGAAQITILQADAAAKPGPVTRVTAGKFTATFDERSRLRSLHGAPDAAIVSVNSGQPDRVSTSQTLDVAFKPQGGLDALLQDGTVHYRDGQRETWAGHARYSPADQTLGLTGSPRIVEQGTTTTAQTVRLDRLSGEVLAEGGVKSTYSALKPQPGGALLASSDPIHVTARSMHAQRDPGTATYLGNARLWQGPNLVQAGSIEFDRSRRVVVAKAGSEKKVSTMLVQTGSDGKVTLVSILSTRLTYADGDRKVHFEGGVAMKSADLTIAADELDAFLLATEQTISQQQFAGMGRLEKVVGQGHVTVQQATRQATGDRLVYTAAEDKFVLTGGPPSIFDAEHGKITGDSLTFFRRDDRVLVEGKDSSPTVTRTRVAR